MVLLTGTTSVGGSDPGMEWFTTTAGHFKYFFSQESGSNIEDARAACRKHGAELAYSEIIHEETYRFGCDVCSASLF